MHISWENFLSRAQCLFLLAFSQNKGHQTEDSFFFPLTKNVIQSDAFRLGN